MLLRDNKPTIPFPNMWDFPGGVVEAGETPRQAVRREMNEELGIKLNGFKFLKAYNWPEKDEYIFHKKIDLNPAEIHLCEGQKIQYFRAEKSY